MGVTETLRILLTIFLSTACIQNVRLFGVYDVRWPFLAEIHTAPLKRSCLLVYSGSQSIAQCTSSVSRVLGRCGACGLIEHSAHSTPLPFGFRTWLRRYTCLLLLMSMLWHRQAIFRKGDKSSSSAECRIWTRVFGNESPAYIHTY